MSHVPAFFSTYQQRVDEVLTQLVVPERGPVDRAMAYSVFAPSKRVRPVLTQLAAELCDTADRALAPFGAKADRLRELSAFVAARRL